MNVARALLLALTIPLVAHAENPAPGDRDDAVLSHVEALEKTARSGLSGEALGELLKAFERAHCAQAFIDRANAAERLELFERVVEAFRGSKRVDVVISPDDVRIDLFPPEKTYEITLGMQADHPFAVASLTVEDVTGVRPRYTLTAENLAETFAELAQSGFTGVVHVRKDGEILLDEAYGLANEELGYPIKRDTVFGIGSTPMDFTYVAIKLLEQRGEIQLDDTLERFFDRVPEDKQNITIRHLMNGESGLPDFFHTEDDWDPDIAYIDRATAEERLLGQELLFEPGTDNRSSHGAYGLLSSIIERVSGKDYFTFLNENFFEPAGMTRTAMYGETMGLPLSEFAVGQGPEYFGLPNIPPNWGKTSWLVLGSGGMCSTLDDMLKFFALVRSGEVLKPPYNARFNRFGASLNGSVRGAYLSHAYKDADNEAMVMSNIDADSPREGDVDEKMQAIVQALEELIAD